MNRTTLSLAAAVTALAAVTGYGALTAPADGGGTATAAKAPARLPVERSSLLCPAPSNSQVAETVYTSFTPAGGAPGSGATAGEAAGRAELKPSAATGDVTTADPRKANTPRRAAVADKPVLALTQPGRPVTAEADGGDAPALVGAASGRLAPGWTTQQTTKVPAGGGRGMLGLSCTPPDTDFWFPGASTVQQRADYVHLTNPDDTATVVDIELYGPGGALKTQLTEGITVPARSGVPVLLSTLTSAPAAEDVTVHVTTRSGRVGAVVRSADEKLGSDWLPASADPAGSLVMPGIPADATSVRLVAYAPGEDDADLRIQLASPTGTITPAAAESLHVKSGMTAAVDLKDVTRGEAGSLLLTPARKGRATPVVAALRVVRGKGDDQEVAFIPATGPVGERATVADNRAEGTTLSLTAPGGSVEVKVTASAGTEGGTPVTKTYKIPSGTTLAVPPPVPAGLKGSYALTVESVSGGPVHAARTLAEPDDGLPMFTVQTFADDRGTVEVPSAEQDLTVLDD
ncbi:DUF5719 family protein [Streptomyces lavendofoliae]|uniref:DUF5719 family protein n=1 Tax=Streptomyces lavendofoliae TaxID=67314 RepID=UPI00300F643A